ncbi:MAG: Crp/Fnr family transcriptional regulator [Lactobacillales bacterium]|jgi:CRP-like cAMP-binding protein|nr:Crp/Fnr family transcriptional regulator [Lactobacillales bacterium]
MLVSKSQEVASFESFRNHEYFENMTDDEFETLANAALLRKYHPKHTLFDVGDPMTRAFLLIDGVIRFESYGQDGESFYYDYINGTDVFPSEGLCWQETYNFSAQAMTTVYVYSFPTALLENIIFKNQNQALYTMKVLSRIIKDYETRIQMMLSRSTSGRVESNLLYLKERIGIRAEDGVITIPYPITYKEIAENSGTTAETARQIIGRMIACQELDYTNKKLKFLK